MGKGGREVSLSVFMGGCILDLLQIEKYTLTPCFDCFSISSEILIDFGLTLFTVLLSPADIS